MTIRAMGTNDRATVAARAAALLGAQLAPRWQPQPHQIPPPGNWTGWLLMAGRGAGKSKACAEYVRQHVFFCTQPMEEPENPQHFYDLLEMFGDAVSQILFATDYPHWDWDAPDQAFPVRISPELQRQIYFENAARLYKLA